MIEVRDGWFFGTLRDHVGREIRVERFDRNNGATRSPGPYLLNPPNPCLHTTEGGSTLGDRYKFWDFPPEAACGDFRIVQLYRYGLAGHAVDTKDRFLYQIELADRVAAHPPNQVRLPPASTLSPLVALAAFLHRTNRVSTFLERPNPSWPVALDRLPAATEEYYRRNDGTWPKRGVYAHVEIPDDEHWDAGSFDYPAFFAMVRDAIQHQEEDGDDMTTAQDIIAGSAAGREAPLDKPPPTNVSPIWRWAYNEAQRIRKAARTPEPTQPGPHEHNLQGKAI